MWLYTIAWSWPSNCLPLRDNSNLLASSMFYFHQFFPTVLIISFVESECMLTEYVSISGAVRLQHIRECRFKTEKGTQRFWAICVDHLWCCIYWITQFCGNSHHDAFSHTNNVPQKVTGIFRSASAWIFTASTSATWRKQKKLDGNSMIDAILWCVATVLILARQPCWSHK